MKSKCFLFGVAIVLMAINFLNADFSVLQQLSPTDLLPVIAVALVIFLLKAGLLSAILIGFKKLLKKIRKGDR